MAPTVELTRASLNLGPKTSRDARVDRADKLGDLDALRDAGAVIIWCQEAGDQWPTLRVWLAANPGWQVFVEFAHGGGKVPILYDARVVRLERKLSRVVEAHPGGWVGPEGAGGTTIGPKALTHAVFTHLATGQRLDDLNHHLVASHTRDLSDAENRARDKVADAQADAFNREARLARAAGGIVSGGGDWNATQRWVRANVPGYVIDNDAPTHHGKQIDHVGHFPDPDLTVVGSRTVETSGFRKLDDHKAVLVTVALAPVADTKPDPEPKPPTEGAILRLPDNFPQLLRDAGLKVVEIDGWQDRGRPASTGGFEPVGTLVHHTGSSDRRPDSLVDDREYAEWLAKVGRPDLPAPLCQWSTGRDGTIYVIAAGRANHAGVARASGSVAAGDGNRLYVGDEAQNNGTEGFTKVQRDAIVTAHAVVHVKVLHTSHRAVSGHRETSTTGKWDPGKLDLDELRADIAKRMEDMADNTPTRERKPNKVQRANALVAEALTELRKASRLLDDAPKSRRNLHRLDGEIEALVKELAIIAEALPGGAK